MTKSELFKAVLAAVVAETEVSEVCILSRCHLQEVVDARSLLVHFLCEEGMNMRTIAGYMNCSRRCVENLHSSFQNRYDTSGKMFKAYHARLAKKLRSIAE